METIDSRKRAVYWIHTFVYFLITFCFGYLPFHALTPFGMTIVGIFIGLLYGWTFIGFVWPSMMSIFALGLCGYFKTPQAAFANAFSNHLVIFMLLVLVFTAYCEKSGHQQEIVLLVSKPERAGGEAVVLHLYGPAGNLRSELPRGRKRSRLSRMEPDVQCIR